jgi:hypothetical protein
MVICATNRPGNDTPRSRRRDRASARSVEVLVSAPRLSLLRAHRRSPFGWDRFGGRPVIGGHLIPVICRPACSMRSISGVADRPKRGPSRLLLAACGVRA